MSKKPSRWFRRTAATTVVFYLFNGKPSLYRDCLPSNCKHLLKTMYDLKPFYEAKVKQMQES